MDQQGGFVEKTTVSQLVRLFETQTTHKATNIKKAQSVPYDLNRLKSDNGERMFNFSEILSKINAPERDEDANSTEDDAARVSERSPRLKGADRTETDSSVDVNYYVSCLHEMVEVLLEIGQLDSYGEITESEKSSCLETIANLHDQLKEHMDAIGKEAGYFKKRYLLKTNFRESLDSIYVKVDKWKLNETVETVSIPEFLTNL